MTAEKIAKFDEIIRDEEVVKAFGEAGSLEGELKVLNDNGLDITLDEYKEYVDSIAESEELSEDELESVAGGVSAAGIIIKYGLKALKKILECNKYTNWGRNGKKCKCGYHKFVEGLFGLK